MRFFSLRPILGVIFILTLIMGLVNCEKRDQSYTHEISLTHGWYIQADDRVAQGGDKISIPEFKAENWFETTVPSTVLAALVKAGVYRDIYFGKNLDKIKRKQFKQSWWYRTTFDLTGVDGANHFRLWFDGINYRANVWLNGEQIATANTMAGAFRLFQLDISNCVKPKQNVLAIEVFPPQPGEFSIGFVDWNPTPPDNNMGIWRGVHIRASGFVSIDDVFVQSKVNTKTLDQAKLTISASLKNHKEQPQTVEVRGTIGKVIFKQTVDLKGKETREVYFTPETYKQLVFNNPQLWWPVHLGKPQLHTLKVEVVTNKKRSDSRQVTFGIREVGDYVNENGYRGYTVNGKKVLIRGGGWVDDLLLAEEEERLEHQIRYARHMNLNTLRLEGFWGSGHKLYDLADKYGIMLMAGWSTQWEWENYLGKKVDEFGGIKTPEEMELMSRSFQDQVKWLRNHPSIFVWVVGSDRLPRPQLEKKYAESLKKTDPSRPLLAACKELESEVSGSTGVKMTGPYDYVTPNYWYEDKKLGGAFGFNTETGPGPQPPPLESLKKMIPGDKLWPINELWDFHSARNEFNTIKNYVNVLNHRYGEAKSVEEFLIKSQLASYEAIRAMFEAYSVRKPVTTGIIQWMYNSAWPAMFWQLYDYYLMPSGAFYGTRKANQPLTLIYDYENGDIYMANAQLQPFDDLQVEIKLVNLDGRMIFTKKLQSGITANSSHKVYTLPKIKDLTSVYFLDLTLRNGEGKDIAGNFYWLSKKKDILDFTKSNWIRTPNKRYADFKLLATLPKITLNVSHRFEAAGEQQHVSVTLENNSNQLAFFIELKVMGQQSQQTILPVLWQDNYISILPGQKRTVRATFFTKALQGQVPVFKYSGWNVSGN